MPANELNVQAHLRAAVIIIGSAIKERAAPRTYRNLGCREANMTWNIRHASPFLRALFIDALVLQMIANIPRVPMAPSPVPQNNCVLRRKCSAIWQDGGFADGFRVGNL